MFLVRRDQWKGKSVQSVMLVAVTFLLLLLNGSTNVSAKSTSKACLNIHLSGTLPRPSKKGNEIRQVVTLNNDCTVREGPSVEVPASIATPNLPGSVTKSVPQVSAYSSTSQSITPLGTYTNQKRCTSEIYDPVGILLTGLYCNDAWSGDFTNVTSYNVGGSASWHTESLYVQGTDNRMKMMRQSAHGRVSHVERHTVR